ncbi:MAG: phage holin [Alloprevotella sp.]|nr:phage holin [Alloprevotella sp.]
MINWEVRIKNKNFWVSLIPMLLLLAQTVASVFGFTLDFGELGNKLLAVVEVLFSLLALLGIVNDPTTESLSDSRQAMTYETPKAKGE